MKNIAVFLSTFSLVLSVESIKVVEPSKNLEETGGYFTVKDLSIDTLDEFTMCLKLKSYNFGIMSEQFLQNILYHGDSMLAVITNQYCDHLSEGCTVYQRQEVPDIFWEHGKSSGYHKYLGQTFAFKIWRPEVWNSFCILASQTNRFYKIFMNGEYVQDFR